MMEAADAAAAAGDGARAVAIPYTLNHRPYILTPNP